MLAPYRKLLDLLTPRHRRIFWALVCLMILTSFAEVLGLSVFVVLLSVLAEPERIPEIAMLQRAYEWFGFEDIFSFQIALSLVVAAVILLGLVVKAVSAFAIVRFSALCGYSISWRLLQGYLKQPYAWSLDRNSAELSKSILADAEQVAAKVATPALRIMANLLLALSITAFLIRQDPVIAIVSMLLMGGGYSVIYIIARSRLHQMGADAVEANRIRFRLAQEATNGLKEVKLAGLEDSYVTRFRTPSLMRALQLAKVQLVAEVPRFALEALTFFILLSLVLVLLIRNNGDLTAAIPTLGIFVFAVMRMLPALQQVYHGLASLKSGAAVVDILHADFMAVVGADDDPTRTGGTDRLALQSSIAFDKISYRYPSAQRAAVTDLSLEIKANSTIGVVGGTGAGKTTFIDLILGLLRHSEGQILIDGVPLTDKTLGSWQRTIGYVPQQIYLTDDTLAANIAFGVPKDQIRQDAVERAAKVAAMHDFIQTELENGYETIVGERGSRLSGGQRQRIGIARALYHDPSVLIMDEATSALDTITEMAVMDAVQNLRNQKTIILVAHRLSTVRNCDTIFLMEQGKVGAMGTYAELAEQSTTFRRMIDAGLTES